MDMLKQIFIVTYVIIIICFIQLKIFEAYILVNIK